MILNKLSRAPVRVYPFWRVSGCRIVNFSNAADDTKLKRETVALAYSEYDESPSTNNRVPLVITHGLFGSKTNWHSIAKALNKQTKRKIITFDLRCHGDSPHSPEIDFDLMKEDIFQLLTSLKISKAIVMGHSLGGRAVLTFSLKYPQMIDRLISVDISPVERSTTDPSIHYLQAMSEMKFDPAFSVSQARKFGDQELSSVVKDIGIRQFLLTNLTKDENGIRWRCDVQSLLANIYNFFIMPTGERIFDGPTLFIGGAKSNYILKEDHEMILQTFPNAEFVSIPDAGHWVHADKPQEFMAEVVKFCNLKLET